MISALENVHEKGTKLVGRKIKNLWTLRMTFITKEDMSKKPNNFNQNFDRKDVVLQTIE
jgi:hypothetical protein